MPRLHRRHPPGALLTALVDLLLAGAAGCGSEDPAPAVGAERPDDFALTFEHVDGSVPPPGHQEWIVEVAADGSGTLEYLPDYPGEGVPTYRAEFEADPTELDALFAELAAEGLLEEEIGGSDDPPVGGDTETATITAEGESFDVPAFDGSDEAALAGVSEAVRGLVPDEIWSGFERRRDAYAGRVHGETP